MSDANEITKPTPDPTVLTTQQLHEATDRVKELMTSELRSLERLFGERFDSVENQFTLVEQQRVEQKVDTKSAVDAALIAQKEAVREQTTASERAIAKSEAATTKQLEQLNATFATAIKGVTDTIIDTKDRVGRIEAIKQGVQENKSAFSTTAILWIGVLGLLVSALAVIVVVVLANGSGP